MFDLATLTFAGMCVTAFIVLATTIARLDRAWHELRQFHHTLDARVAEVVAAERHLQAAITALEAVLDTLPTSHTNTNTTLDLRDMLVRTHAMLKRNGTQ